MVTLLHFPVPWEGNPPVTGGLQRLSNTWCKCFLCVRLNKEWLPALDYCIDWVSPAICFDSMLAQIFISALFWYQAIFPTEPNQFLHNMLPLYIHISSRGSVGWWCVTGHRLRQDQRLKRCLRHRLLDVVFFLTPSAWWQTWLPRERLWCQNVNLNENVSSIY